MTKNAQTRYFKSPYLKQKYLAALFLGVMSAGCEQPGSPPTLPAMPEPPGVMTESPERPLTKTFSVERKDYLLGTAAGPVLVADFNGDRKLDVVVKGFILLGDGMGNLGPPAAVAVGNTWMTAADFDGDGKLDVAWDDPDQLHVALGDGAGGFGAAIDTPTLAGGEQFFGPLAPGDLNGDGIPDLAIRGTGMGTGTGTPSTRVGVLLGTGRGTFSPITAFPSIQYADYVALADFDGDKNLDYVACAGDIAVHFGDGKGGLGPASDYPIGGGISPMTLGDFNGDSKLDFATANKMTDKMTVLLNDGTGRFSGLPAFGSGGRYPRTLVAGDFNGDKKLDLIAENRVDVTMGVFFGDGLGGFGAPSLFPLPAQTCWLQPGDFDRDGMDDLAVFCGKTLAILLSRMI